jgi:hypothetical protein
MSFVPGQRPWSQLNNSWQGIFDAVGELPNVAGSTLQMGTPNVQVGDLAYVAGLGLYVCHDPTPGAAVWTLISGSGGGGVVGPANVVYLNEGGNDGTAQRGNAALPFGTFAAAAAAMFVGDQMRISPGFFDLGAGTDMTGLTSFSIVGSGEQATHLTGDGTGDLIRLPNVAGAGGLVEISGLRMTAPLGTRCIIIDGNGGGGTTGNAFLHDLLLTADAGAEALRIQFCDNIRLDSITTVQGQIVLSDSNIDIARDIFCQGAALTDGINFGWQASADAPTRTTSYFTSVECQLANIIISGAPDINVDITCVFGGVSAGSLLDDGGILPNIFFSADVGTTGALFTLPDTATPGTNVNLSNITLRGAITVEVAAPAANRITVPMLYMELLNSSLITIGDGIDAIALGFVMDNVGLATTPGTGTFTPAQIGFSGRLLGAGATTVSFGFTAGGPPNFVTAIARSLAASPLACTAKTAASVDISSTVGGSGDIICTWGL